MPIYTGGNNRNDVKRTAAYGDGWLPAVMPVEQLESYVVRLREMTEQNGREFDRIDVAPQFIACLGKTHELAIKQFQQSQMYSHLSSLRASTLKGQAGFAFEDLNLVGTADEIVTRAGRLGEAGVKHLAGIMFCAVSSWASPSMGRAWTTERS